MMTLANLKMRLEALPIIRDCRDLEDRYSAFLKTTAVSRAQATQSVVASSNCAKVLPSAGYEEAVKVLKRAVSSARRLKADLDLDPKMIQESGVEKRFTVMNENAAGAWAMCQRTWQQEIQSSVESWKILGDVIRRVFGSRGETLASAVRELGEAGIPNTDEEVKKVRGHLKALNDTVSNLGLQTEFGRFLSSVASPQGAALDDAEKPDVKKVIEKYKIGKVLRIKLA